MKNNDFLLKVFAVLKKDYEMGREFLSFALPARNLFAELFKVQMNEQQEKLFILTLGVFCTKMMKVLGEDYSFSESVLLKEIEREGKEAEK